MLHAALFTKDMMVEMLAFSFQFECKLKLGWFYHLEGTRIREIYCTKKISMYLLFKYKIIILKARCKRVFQENTIFLFYHQDIYIFKKRHNLPNSQNELCRYISVKTLLICIKVHTYLHIRRNMLIILQVQSQGSSHFRSKFLVEARGFAFSCESY